MVMDPQRFENSEVLLKMGNVVLPGISDSGRVYTDMLPVPQPHGSDRRRNRNGPAQPGWTLGVTVNGGSQTVGQTLWLPLGSMAIDVTTANGTTPGTLYAGNSQAYGNAYIAELNPSGSANLFSIYQGGLDGSSSGAGIALEREPWAFLLKRSCLDARCLPTDDLLVEHPPGVREFERAVDYLLKLEGL